MEKQLKINVGFISAIKGWPTLSINRCIASRFKNKKKKWLSKQTQEDLWQSSISFHDKIPGEGRNKGNTPQYNKPCMWQSYDNNIQMWENWDQTFYNKEWGRVLTLCTLSHNSA